MRVGACGEGDMARSVVVVVAAAAAKLLMVRVRHQNAPRDALAISMPLTALTRAPGSLNRSIALERLQHIEARYGSRLKGRGGRVEESVPTTACSLDYRRSSRRSRAVAGSADLSLAAAKTFRLVLLLPASTNLRGCLPDVAGYTPHCRWRKMTNSHLDKG